ncbi:hypothetical protein LOC68_03945 [Blastopirellula sp. JC732]|uniref:Uncharacterized protein n=1 Tax=Blastopirellula sediminis TaxID=2894196 RepID=A0A9X1SE80_9BACT|nr:hypothetical protein [Blastopirellula sediminis]MCC9609689.1 hypothetical protein [Blastopirellula sediminis]MCC9627535.1 hypothetical protein [Blastopirellula sediminis]
MKLSWKIAAAAFLTLLLALGGVGVYLYQAAQYVPEFYTQALEIEPAQAKETGEILEEQVFAFTNEVRKPSRWQLRLTNDQINGWLASDLEEKFPKLLPEGMHDPRIAIEERQVKLGCRFEGQQFHSVLSLEVDAYLVEDEENVVAIQIHNVSAGSLPFPLGSLLNEISRRAEEAKIPLRWQQVDGDPVALVTVPSEGDEIDGTIRIDTLELRKGEILLAGETTKTPEVESGPSEPVAPEATTDQEIKTASRPMSTLP